MFTLQFGHKVYNDEKAGQSVADALTAQDEDGWTYKVNVDLQTGKAIIGIYDEDGVFVHYY